MFMEWNSVAWANAFIAWRQTHCYIYEIKVHRILRQLTENDDVIKSCGISGEETEKRPAPLMRGYSAGLLGVSVPTDV